MVASAGCARLRFLFTGLALLVSTIGAQAQTAPHGYDFLTVTTMESPYKKEPYLQFAPAFQGQSLLAIPVSNLYTTSPEELAKVSDSITIINQQLSALTAGGWELAQMSAAVTTGSRLITRYLFRKPRP